MITLIGIGHVFSIRDAVKYIIYQRRPNAVCVELDIFRFEILDKGLDRSKDAPFLMKRLQKVYDKAAQTQGAQVGEELLARDNSYVLQLSLSSCVVSFKKISSRLISTVSMARSVQPFCTMTSIISVCGSRFAEHSTIWNGFW